MSLETGSLVKLIAAVQDFLQERCDVWNSVCSRSHRSIVFTLVQERCDVWNSVCSRSHRSIVFTLVHSHSARSLAAQAKQLT